MLEYYCYILSMMICKVFRNNLLRYIWCRLCVGLLYWIEQVRAGCLSSACRASHLPAQTHVQKSKLGHVRCVHHARPCHFGALLQNIVGKPVAYLSWLLHQLNFPNSIKYPSKFSNIAINTKTLSMHLFNISSLTMVSPSKVFLYQNQIC